MRTLIAIIALFLGAALPALAQPPPGEPLAITIAGAGANARRLEHYDLGQKIAVSVNVAQGIGAITVHASSPDGIEQSLSLSRGSDGIFSGLLTLETAGTWNIELITKSGSTSTTTTPFMIDVRERTDTPWLVGVAVGGSVFALVGGSGFVLLRREASAASQRS